MFSLIMRLTRSGSNGCPSKVAIDDWAIPKLGQQAQVPKQSSGPSEAIGRSPALERLPKPIQLRPEVIMKTIKITRRYKTVKKKCFGYK